LKKIKVTKRVSQKVPWYEKPPLLFGAIAAVLLVSGVIMGHLNSRTGRTGGGGGADSLAIPDDDELGDRTTSVLGIEEALPAARSGACLPPIRTDTRREAATARRHLREARGLDAWAGSGPLETGFAFLPAEAWLEEGDVARSSALREEFRPWVDFEIHHDAGGNTYVLGFVPLDVAGGLGALGPDVPLTEAPPVERIPKWQFWRKAPPPDRAAMYHGTEIRLYPDLSVEATCLVAMPLSRIQPLRVTEVRSGVDRPIHTIEVALR